jgi:hypothetical protein
MTTTTITIPEPKHLLPRICALLADAQALVIDSPESYEASADLWRKLKTEMREIDETFDPSIKAGHISHKTALAAKARHAKPRDVAEIILGNKRSTYRTEQEQKRQAEERRLQAIARKQEEERQLAEAVHLEEEGRKAEAEAVMQAPVQTPLVVVASRVPKQEGLSRRVVWKHRTINPFEVPREYLMVDEKNLAAHARSMKDMARVPGVEFFAVETKESVKPYEPY